ncbi:hypothetical protein ABZ738_32435 [Micromonospora sp. NPDC047793]|uniref:hypothetical protein n=1 Tax=Micromonospora sp. NPDC047793 TaxID=3154342 RepID=UPI00340CA01F
MMRHHMDTGVRLLAGTVQMGDTTVGRWTPASEVDIATAALEVEAWCSDTRRFKGAHKAGLRSTISDFRHTASSLGPMLGYKLRDKIHPLLDRLTDVWEAIAPKEPSQESVAAARAAAAAAVHQVLGALHQTDTLVTAWTDLHRLCLAEDSDWHVVARSRDNFVQIAALLGHDPRQLGMRLPLLISGDPYTIERVRSVVDPGSESNCQWVPLADRIELFSRYLAQPIGPRRQVVWFALRRAILRQLKISFGAIDFYYAPVLHAVATGPQRTALLPPELQGTSLFGLKQMPDEDDIVYARVDLGFTTVREPIREAKDVLVGTLGMVKFGGRDSGNWQLMTGYVHGVNDHIVAHEVFWPRDERPRLAYSLDATPDSLTTSADCAGITSPDNRTAREVRAAIRWCDEAEDQGAAAATLLYVRVIELFASRMKDRPWQQFLDDYVRPGWIRTRMHIRIFDVTYRGLHPSDILHTDEDLDTLRHETYTDSGSFVHGTPSAVWNALERLSSMGGAAAVPALEINSLLSRMRDPSTVHSWHNDTRTQWSFLRTRLQRVRNSLAHGGPYTDQIIDNVSDYARDLARTVLDWGILAIGSDTELATVAEERRARDTDWESKITTAPNSFAALFGDAM